MIYIEVTDKAQVAHYNVVAETAAEIVATCRELAPGARYMAVECSDDDPAGGLVVGRLYDTDRNDVDYDEEALDELWGTMSYLHSANRYIWGACAVWPEPRRKRSEPLFLDLELLAQLKPIVPALTVDGVRAALVALADGHGAVISEDTLGEVTAYVHDTIADHIIR